MDHPEQVATPQLLMVVRRGDDERYELLRKLFQSQRVNVVLDRRAGDRRGGGRPASAPQEAGGERRAGERRAALPDTWVNLGFFVARAHHRH